MSNDYKKYYKDCAYQVYELFACFQEVGFSEDQAFELCGTYVRQSVFENMMQEMSKPKKTASRAQVLRRYKDND